MPPIRSRNLPRYATRAGDPCFPPPYIVDDAGMDIFICEGDPEALARMINRALNIPTARQYGTPDKLRFELADPLVGFACIDVRYLRSKPVPDQRVKPLPEHITGVYARQAEVAVMVQVRDNAGLPYWYLPYVLNDLPTAVTTGREVYGYPKQSAVFALVEPAEAGPSRPLFGPDRSWQRLVVHAYDLVLPDSGSEAEFALTPVLEFRRGPASKEEASKQEAAEDQPRVTPALSPDDFAIYPGTCATENGSPVRERSLAAKNRSGGVPETASAEFLERIRSDIPYVFLRQFREPAKESLASYQALVIGRLVPDSADRLQIERSHDFTLVMPWAFNLALAQEVFGRQQLMERPDVAPAPIEAAVVGLLSGRNATFDVLRAAILWQFGLDNRTNARAVKSFEDWRFAALDPRRARSEVVPPKTAGQGP